MTVYLEILQCTSENKDLLQNIYDTIISLKEIYSHSIIFSDIKFILEYS